MGFKALVIGVGDAFSVKHAPSSLLLMCEGFSLAIDCPDRFPALLMGALGKAGLDLPVSQVDDVLITHVHGDHMNGLEGLGFLKKFGESKRLKVHCAGAVREMLWEGRLASPMGTLLKGSEVARMSFEDYFDWRELSESEPTLVGPFTIRIRRTIHHVPTFALMIEAGDATLGYSSDTAFDPSLIDFLSSGDLIIHETNYGPAHTPYAALAALPQSLHSRIRLIHYPDDFDAGNSLILPLNEGELLEVG